MNKQESFVHNNGECNGISENVSFWVWVVVYVKEIKGEGKKFSFMFFFPLSIISLLIILNKPLKYPLFYF
jgi:hypothetical protein